MNIKIKKNISIILLIVSILSLVSAVFAWFLAVGGSVNNIVITVGEVKAEVKLYKGQDFNYDGIIDIDENNEEVFNKIETYPDKTDNLNIGSTITYKMVVKNIGTIDNIIKFSYLKSSLQLDNAPLAKVMSIQFFDENKTLQNNKRLLYMSTYDDVIDVKENDTNNYEPKVLRNSTLILYIKIVFEDLESLKTLNPTDFTGQITNLNEYLEKSFTLPQFIIRIEQSIDEVKINDN